jgi:hypothetical protein
MTQVSRESDKFDEAMKQVLSVSHKELKAREEKWKKQRKSRKKKKAKT